MSSRCYSNSRQEGRHQWLDIKAEATACVSRYLQMWFGSPVLVNDEQMGKRVRMLISSMNATGRK
jgi:hypothetical protein